MGARTGKACGEWSGAGVFGRGRLSCAGDFILILDDLMEGVPEVRDGFVFGGHGENLLSLAIEHVCEREEFFETLLAGEGDEWGKRFRGV